jgi:transcriptional regulator with XRE-family HTH domain
VLPLIQNIRIIRKQKGISQESVAYDLGIDYSTYGKIERGQIALTVDRLEKIAKILGVTIDELYQWNSGLGPISPDLGPDKESPQVKELKIKLQKAFAELEALRREVGLLQEQLKDKEKIIDLLEHNSNKGR